MLKIDRIQYSGYEILYPDPETAIVTAVYVFTTFMYFQISLVLWIKMSALPRWVLLNLVLHHILFFLKFSTMYTWVLQLCTQVTGNPSKNEDIRWDLAECTRNLEQCI